MQWKQIVTETVILPKIFYFFWKKVIQVWDNMRISKLHTFFWVNCLLKYWFPSLYVTNLVFSYTGVHLGCCLRSDWLSDGGVSQVSECKGGSKRWLPDPGRRLLPAGHKPVTCPGSGLHRHTWQPYLPGACQYRENCRSDRCVQGDVWPQHRVPSSPGGVHESQLPWCERPSPILHRGSCSHHH